MPRFIKPSDKQPKEEFKVNLTKEDIRNGWTEDTLREYLSERDNQKREHAAAKQYAVPKMENAKTFNPHNWNR